MTRNKVLAIMGIGLMFFAACTKKTTASREELAAKRLVTIDMTNAGQFVAIAIVGDQGQGTFVWTGTGSKSLPDFGTYTISFLMGNNNDSCAYTFNGDGVSLLLPGSGGNATAAHVTLADNYYTGYNCR